MNNTAIVQIAQTFLVLVVSCTANALPITSSDFDGIVLGAKIVGPVGPEVETSLVNSVGQAIGDLASSVSCPAGLLECSPPSNPAGTIYTYVHQVIPGIDLPNDPPFPNPVEVTAFANVSEFTLGFSASGFNGTAGYSFSEAAAADVSFDIDISASGMLRWIANSANWGSNQQVTFFWQTTQPPVGPGGTYTIANAQDSGSGAGPLPLAIEVMEPDISAWLFASLLALLVANSRGNKKTRQG